MLLIQKLRDFQEGDGIEEHRENGWGKLVSDIKELGDHPYSGRSVLMGRVTAEWRNTTILGLFGDKVSVARRRYLGFPKQR